MAPSSPSDHQLILYAQKGDMQAFEELVYRYDKHVFAIAARFGNYADDAKDIYQEVFLRVFRGLKNFQHRSEFQTWLYRITTNVCLTHRSHKSRSSASWFDVRREDDGQAPAEVPATDASPESQAISSDIADRVEAALRILSPRQRLVFTLRHYQAYKLKEIADMMDCTEGTVKRYLFSATQKMREELKHVYE
jgi:RNA polymerase sigma-70 factor (ECF subfamily)